MAPKKTVEAEVVLTLGDRLTAGLNRIQARLSRLTSGLGINRITSSLGNLGSRIGAIGPAVGQAIGRLSALTGVMGVGAGGAAMAAFTLTNRVADAAKEIENLSRLSGIGAEDFQKYAYAANSVGISGEKMADIFKDVQDKVGDFIQTGGGGMADFFENIAPKVGVTADDFARLSGPEALQLYVSSLEKANVSQSDMVFYMEAIASDSTLLLPLLRDNGTEMRRLGDEAERTGNIMSDAAVAAGKEFSEGIRSLQARVSGVATVIGVSLLPVMNEVVGEITGWVDANRELIRSTITEWATKFANVLRDLMDPTSALRQGFGDLVDRVTGFYDAIAPVIDLIGGPGVASLAALALWIGAPLLGPLTALTIAVGKLGLALMLTPIGWILAGLVAMGAAVYVLIQKWDEFVAYWGGMWDRIKAGFEQGFVVGILNILNEFNPVVHVARGMDAVLVYFTGFSLIDAGTKVIRDFGASMGSAFVAVLTWAGGIGSAIVQAIIDGLSAAWNGLVDTLNTKIAELIGFLPDWAKEGLGFKVTGEVAAPPPAPGVPPVDPPGITSVDSLPVPSSYTLPSAPAVPNAVPEVNTQQVDADTVNAQRIVIPEPIVATLPQNVNAPFTSNITVNVQGMTEQQGQRMVQRAIASEQAKHSANVTSALND